MSRVEQVRALVELALERARADAAAAAAEPVGQRWHGFRCPECGWVSQHPLDLANGYCGHCHAFTGNTPGPVS